MTIATMVRPLMLLAATTLFGANVGSAQAAPAPIEFDAKAEAQKVIDALGARKFGEVEAKFSAQMAAALPAGRLAMAWDQLHAQAGALKAIGEPQVQEQNGMTIVTFPAEYEQGKLNIVIAWDGERKLAGLLAQPAG